MFGEGERIGKPLIVRELSVDSEEERGTAADSGKRRESVADSEKKHEHEPSSGSGKRLNGVHIRLSPGEWLYVVGVNGSGKSTLARVVAGLSVAGAAGMADRGFAGETPAAYVMQQPDAQLFGETPREEIVFALEWAGLPAADIPGRAEAVMEKTGMSAWADLPWKRLSGGQRQLAAVAAAAAGSPALIVFDEATAMLDEAAARIVRELAGELHLAGAAVVWVTQRLEELEPEARVVAVAEGRLVYDGDGRSFLYGGDALNGGESPCEACGLRLPYLAAFAAELHRHGELMPPLPMTEAEWEAATRVLLAKRERVAAAREAVTRDG